MERIIEIYREAAALYESVQDSLSENALGYEVLYGPPLLNPPVLFVGYQPGGGKPEPLPILSPSGDPPPWPAIFEYATREFALAKRLQLAFGREFLETCTGLNAIFLRSPSMDAYQQSVPPDVRAKFKALGVGATRDIIATLKPKIIVMISFSAMELFTQDGKAVLKDGDDQWQLSSAELNGTPVYGMRHPTARRDQPSNEDMKRVADHLINVVGSM